MRVLRGASCKVASLQGGEKFASVIVTPKPDKGRARGDECSAYLAHITSRYNALADYTIFLQSDPMDALGGQRQEDLSEWPTGGWLGSRSAERGSFGMCYCAEIGARGPDLDEKWRHRRCMLREAEFEGPGTGRHPQHRLPTTCGAAAQQFSSNSGHWVPMLGRNSERRSRWSLGRLRLTSGRAAAERSGSALARLVAPLPAPARRCM